MTVKILPPLKLCTPQQRKFLTQRLHQSRTPSHYISWRDNDRDAEMPKDVRAAKRLLLQWQKQRQRMADASKTIFNRAHEEAKTAILFKGPDEALHAVERYERICLKAREKD